MLIRSRWPHIEVKQSNTFGTNDRQGRLGSGCMVAWYNQSDEMTIVSSEIEDVAAIVFSPSSPVWLSHGDSCLRFAWVSPTFSRYPA